MFDLFALGPGPRSWLVNTLLVLAFTIIACSVAVIFYFAFASLA